MFDEVFTRTLFFPEAAHYTRISDVDYSETLSSWWMPEFELVRSVAVVLEAAAWTCLLSLISDSDTVLGSEAVFSVKPLSSDHTAILRPR
jgi:hypothetical protein